MMYRLLLLIFAFGWFSQGLAEVDSVHISTRLDYNAILITEVDIVFVYSQELVDSFPQTKTQWYSGKRRFTADAGSDLDVVNVFIPQGFDSAVPTLPARRAEALKVYVFAQHDDANIPPVDVTGFDSVLIEIDQFGIVVSRRS